MNTKSKTIRNLLIFAGVTVAAGWVGVWLDSVAATPPGQGGTLGLLLWMVAPLGAALLLRAFGGDGWQDFGVRPAFKGNGGWYAVSLLMYPLAALIGLTLGGVFRIITFPDFTWGRLFSVVALGFVPAFIKNIFEEFAWRGYLAPRLRALSRNDSLVHGLTGLIWGSWHIPYWLFFLGAAQIQATTGQSLAIFVPTALLSLMVASVAYNEIYFLTRSIWPAVLLHTVGNALVDMLVVQNFIKITPGMEVWIAPTHQSLFMLLFFLGVGWELHRRRAKTTANEFAKGC